MKDKKTLCVIQTEKVTLERLWVLYKTKKVTPKQKEKEKDLGVMQNRKGNTRVKI